MKMQKQLMENKFKIASLVLVTVLGLSFGKHLRSDRQPCRSEYLRLVAAQSSSSFALPRCDKQGLYKPLQKTTSSFECYFPDGQLDDIYNYPGEGDCPRLRKCLKNHTSEGDEDHKLIRCDKFGLFEPFQKQEDGSMICILPEGEFPVQYGLAGRERECIDLQPCNQVSKGHWQTFPPRDTTVRCDDQGRFKPLQRFDNKLQCYYPNRADYTDDYAVRGPCRKLRWCLKQKYRTSKGAREHRFIRCDKYGYFKPVQTQDGKMICVDPYGNIRKSSGVTGRVDCLNAIIAH